MKTCLVKINIGDEVMHGERRMKVKSFYLAPNGINSPELVCVVVAQDEAGVVSAVSNRFSVIDDVKYESHYPSDEWKRFI